MGICCECNCNTLPLQGNTSYYQGVRAAFINNMILTILACGACMQVVLVPRYLRFQLPSYSLFLPNQPFSCIYLQHSSSLYIYIVLALCGHLQTQRVCHARVGGGWDPGGHIFNSYCVSAKCVMPWDNRNGWLGLKHQITYLTAVNCQVGCSVGREPLAVALELRWC